MLLFERFKMLSRYLTGLAVGWPSLLKNTVDFFLRGGDPYQFVVGILSSHSLNPDCRLFQINIYKANASKYRLKFNLLC